MSLKHRPPLKLDSPGQNKFPKHLAHWDAANYRTASQACQQLSYSPNCPALMGLGEDPKVNGMNSKVWLKSALALMMLTAFAGLATAQQTSERKSRPMPASQAQPAIGERAIDKASPILMKGTVSSVDAAGMVTAVINGKEKETRVGPEAAKLILKDHTQQVTVCSGGYWWTVKSNSERRSIV
jgi:hypothetical protein